MTLRLFFIIILLALLLTFLYSSATMIIFGFGTSHEAMTEEDWERMDSMPHKEALEFMDQKSTKLSGLDIFLGYFSSFQMFIFYLKGLISTFLVIVISSLLSCFLTLKYIKK